MKITKFSLTMGVLTLLSLATSFAGAMTVTASNDVNALVNALAGTGVSITNATLSTAGLDGAGTFTGATDAIGFDKGVLLTTGTINCAPGPNSQGGCTGLGTTTSLKFDFTSDTGNILFKYVFASEEYNEWVGSEFTDLFELRLNGNNIALLPGAAGVVSINNVNNTSNSSFYRDNTVLGLNTQYDGLTTVLIAQASGLIGTNTFEFLIQDIGDAGLDSGMFIQAGTFSSGNLVSEPGSFALLGLGLIGLSARKRKQA